MPNLLLLLKRFLGVFIILPIFLLCIVFVRKLGIYNNSLTTCAPLTPYHGNVTLFPLDNNKTECAVNVEDDELINKCRQKSGKDKIRCVEYFDIFQHI